jgi:hypothetical protein
MQTYLFGSAVALLPINNHSVVEVREQNLHSRLPAMLREIMLEKRRKYITNGSFKILSIN